MENKYIDSNIIKINNSFKYGVLLEDYNIIDELKDELKNNYRDIRSLPQDKKLSLYYILNKELPDNFYDDVGVDKDEFEIFMKDDILPGYDEKFDVIKKSNKNIERILKRLSELTSEKIKIKEYINITLYILSPKDNIKQNLNIFNKIKLDDDIVMVKYKDQMYEYYKINSNIMYEKIRKNLKNIHDNTTYDNGMTFVLSPSKNYNDYDNKDLITFHWDMKNNNITVKKKDIDRVLSVIERVFNIGFDIKEKTTYKYIIEDFHINNLLLPFIIQGLLPENDDIFSVFFTTDDTRRKIYMNNPLVINYNKYKDKFTGEEFKNEIDTIRYENSDNDVIITTKSKDKNMLLLFEKMLIYYEKYKNDISDTINLSVNELSDYSKNIQYNFEYKKIEDKMNLLRNIRRKDVDKKLGVDYTKKCSKRYPTIIENDEVEEYENKGYKVLKYKYNNDTTWNLICNHEGFKYPNLLNNGVPCCFNSDRKTPSRSSKTTTKGMNNNIHSLVSFIDKDIKNFKLKSYNDNNLLNLLNKTTNKDYKYEDIKNINYSVYLQSFYDKTEEEISELLDKDRFSSIFFYRGLEEFFKINIMFYFLDTIEFNIRYYNYYLKRLSFKETIIIIVEKKKISVVIYKNKALFGSEEKDKISKHLNDYYSTYFFKKSQGKITCRYNFFSNVDIKNILSQKINLSGKTIGYNFINGDKIFSIFLPEEQPGNYEIDNKIIKQDYKDVCKIFGEPQGYSEEQKNYGLWYKYNDEPYGCFIPINDFPRNLTLITKKIPYQMKEEKKSLLEDMNDKKRKSRLLKYIFLYIKETNKNFFDVYKIIDGYTYDVNIPDTFPDNFDLKFLKDNTNVIVDGKIIYPSLEFKRRIEYYINTTTEKHSKIIKEYYDDVYVFTKQNNIVILKEKDNFDMYVNKFWNINLYYNLDKVNENIPYIFKENNAFLLSSNDDNNDENIIYKGKKYYELV